MTFMKTIEYKQFGGPEVLQIKERQRPSVQWNEVLVEIYFTSATTADWRLRSLNMPKGFSFLAHLIFGFKRPRQSILGTELSGVVVECGARVTKFKVGDLVLAVTGAQMGAYVEYKALDQDSKILKIPESMTLAEAGVFSFGAMTAWSFLVQKTKIQPHEKIFIVGASGSVGSAMIQIAKIKGAQVWALTSKDNFNFIRSLGADQVIDYKNWNPKQLKNSFDKVIDAAGFIDINTLNHLVKKQGEIILVSANLLQMLIGLYWRCIKLFKQMPRVIFGVTELSKNELLQLLDFTTNHGYKTPIGVKFNFEKMQDAHAYVEQRHRQGNVLIFLKNTNQENI